MSEGAARPFVPVGIAVLTVSDSRGLEQDSSGAVLIERLAAGRPRPRRPGPQPGGKGPQPPAGGGGGG
jgi:hypothetical protein